MAATTEAAREVLRANDRGGYTVPTDRLYPFQWNWDSGFVAMGFATFDQSRGFAEIATLLRGQWADGMVPQIVFHAASDDYFPGPAVWGTEHQPPTSGITQPPILACAVRWMLERAADPAAAETAAAALFPGLAASHRWWHAARDPDGTGLVATLHPWETGMDNSPAWDEALARVPPVTRTPIVRRDTAHVDAAMRPRGDEYSRFIHLVEAYRDCLWRPGAMLAAAPFRIADVGTNAILLRAERDLAVLARRFGMAAEAAEIAARAERLAAGLERLWCAADGLYLSRDLIADAPIRVATSAALLPLFAGDLPAERASALAATLRRWGSLARFGVASTAPDDPRFEPRRYWRGPVWAVVNWMLAQGLAGAGEAAEAARLCDTTRRLIETGGFSEYFDPTDGTGIGGGRFSWTAAIYLMLVAPSSRFAL